MVVFRKRSYNGTAFRNALIGYTDQFYFVIADYWNTNSGPNAVTSQFAMLYSAPSLSLVVQGSGYVQMQYGYGNGSDERIK